MMQPEIYADRIFYYKNVIADPARVVALLEESNSTLTEDDAIRPWHEWVASGGGEKYVFGEQKFTNEEKLQSSSEVVRHIYETLKSALTSVGIDYAEKNDIEYVEPAPISISKYRTGADMGAHVDYYGDPGVEPLMSAVLYLNDDVEGGELDFPHHNVRIKPEAGSIIVFPSVDPFYHQSLPTTRGSKYMSPAFWMKRLDN